MTNSPAYTVMQLIADILSLKNNQEALSEQITLTTVDWDAVVRIGSRHLMLPAIFCQLKEKTLSRLIPEDLHLYLEEITDINRNRNEVLLNEAHEISEIFKKENIEHVFIKGIALLAGHNFKDQAERMIGDIDILVAPKQIQRAFEILTEHGYNDTVSFNYEQKNYRHLARQVSEQKFGAIELHSEVLIHKYEQLIINEQVFIKKQIINGLAIPSNEDSIKIAIFGLQINDKAHLMGFIYFKTIYDCMALNLITKLSLMRDLSEEKHAQSFLEMSSVLFKELKPYKTSIYAIFLKRYFICSLKFPKSGRLAYLLLNFIQNTRERLELIIHNKSYRTHLFKNKTLKSKQ